MKSDVTFMDYLHCMFYSADEYTAFLAFTLLLITLLFIAAYIISCIPYYIKFYYMHRQIKQL